MKRFLSCCIVLLFCAGLTVPASAAGVINNYESTTVYTINGKAVSCQSSSANTNCHRFEHDLYTLIWGSNFSSSHSNPHNMLKGFSAQDRKVNVDHLKKYIGQAPLGAAIRITSSAVPLENNNNKGHSLILAAKDNTGFTTLEGNVGNKQRAARTYTWENFTSNWTTYCYINYIIWPNASSGNPGDNSSSPALTVQHVTSGKWIVTIPANHKLLCYPSANAVDSSTYISAKTSAQEVYCTQQATLSNHSTRYFFVSSDNKSLWFDFNSNMTVRAIEKNYTVTFDPNGGSVSPTSKAVSAGNLIGELPTPTRDGYTFLYWCTEKEKSGMVVEPNTVTVENDLTLYAIWRENNTTCTVTFDPNGGNVSPTTKTVVKGSAVGSIPIPVRQGYTFIGWEAENGSLVLHGNEITVDKDMTLCAVWKADEHTHVKINPFIDPQHPHYTTYTCTCGQVIIDDTPGYLETCDICKGPAGCWGEWSGWSSVPVYGSDTRQVETRTVKVSDSYTEYRYGRYIDSTGTHDCWCGKYLEGLSYVSGSASLQYSDWTTAQYPTRGKEWSCGYCGGSHIGVHHTGSDGRAWWKEYVLPGGSYYWEESRLVDAVYETQYRYRDWIVGCR